MLVGVSDNDKCVNDAMVSVCMCRCVCVCVCHCSRIFRDESCLLFFCALGAIFRKRAKPVTFSCEKSKT
jgi:hypothetical protein